MQLLIMRFSHQVVVCSFIFYYVYRACVPVNEVNNVHYSSCGRCSVIWSIKLRCVSPPKAAQSHTTNTLFTPQSTTIDLLEDKQLLRKFKGNIQNEDHLLRQLKDDTPLQVTTKHSGIKGGNNWALELQSELTKHRGILWPLCSHGLKLVYALYSC